MLFQELNKLKRTSINISMVLITLGLIMIICPDRYIDSLIEALGYVLLIVATVMVLNYLSSKKVLFNTIELMAALILALVGTSVLVFKDHILQILGWSFGVLMVLQGIEAVYSALMYVRPSRRRGWWLLTILALMLLAIGVMIFLNPWWDTPSDLLKIIGAALLFDALVGVLRLIWIWPIKAE